MYTIRKFKLNLIKLTSRILLSDVAFLKETSRGLNSSSLDLFGNSRLSGGALLIGGRGTALSRRLQYPLRNWGKIGK